MSFEEKILLDHLPGFLEGLVVVADGEAVHGLAEEDGEEGRAHPEHDRGEEAQEVVAGLWAAKLCQSHEEPPLARMNFLSIVILLLFGRGCAHHARHLGCHSVV